jgi:hypothetical protein
VLSVVSLTAWTGCAAEAADCFDDVDDDDVLLDSPAQLASTKRAHRYPVRIRFLMRVLLPVEDAHVTCAPLLCREEKLLC